MSTGLDAYDFVRPVRPEPEPTAAEQAEARKHQVFAEEASQGGHAGSYARPSPPEQGHLQASAVCVIGDHGHVRMATACPHNLPRDQADYDQVQTVN
jgi:hypothetical protein